MRCGAALADFIAPVGSGNRVKRCPKEGQPAVIQPCRRCDETSDDVTDRFLTAITRPCPAFFLRSLREPENLPGTTLLSSLRALVFGGLEGAHYFACLALLNLRQHLRYLPKSDPGHLFRRQRARPEKLNPPSPTNLPAQSQRCESYPIAGPSEYGQLFDPHRDHHFARTDKSTSTLECL